ncbi:senescence-associated protein-domain-containing protein [Peziza echinospora]|nr:senescence-associated protein-domain-containing protein [Peziza echinospora]
MDRPTYPTAEQEKWAQAQSQSQSSRSQLNAPSNGYAAPPPTYDPSAYGTIKHPQDGQGGTLVLYDMENGNQVGELGEHIQVSGVSPGSQEPVEIDLSRPDGVVTIRPLQPDYLKNAEHPSYANSRLVGTAATASRLLVSAATFAAKAVDAGAKTFTEKTKPVVTPMTFQPSTHNRVRQFHNYTVTGAKVSAGTVGKVQDVAQNLGARLAGKTGERSNEPAAKPGLLNKGMIAFSTIADSIDHASRLILTTGSQAATVMVGHRYGAEAGEIARGITGSVKNVGLVYVDAAGISRRAVVKSVAKGMVVGKVKGGGEVIFQGDNPVSGEYAAQGSEKQGLNQFGGAGPQQQQAPHPLHHSASFPVSSSQPHIHHQQQPWIGAPLQQQGQQYTGAAAPQYSASERGSPAPGGAVGQYQAEKAQQQYNPNTYRY